MVLCVCQNEGFSFLILSFSQAELPLVFLFTVKKIRRKDEKEKGVDGIQLETAAQVFQKTSVVIGC